MEDMRNSNATQPQIVKIVKMVVKFHPLLTITSFIFGVAFLQDWIEKELSNQWNILKVYCQSIIRALMDPITDKTKNFTEALQMHLQKEASKGQPKAKLIAKLALFSATFLLLSAKLSSKYDKRGVKTQFLLLIALDLLNDWKLWSQLRILRERSGCIANSTSNFTFFILALVFAKTYNNSLRSLSAMLCIAIFILCVLVVLRPRTDLGLFSFIIGVIGSITYNQFSFTLPSWIIASICFVLFSFKSWLDKYWLDLEEDQLLTFTNTTVRSTNLFLILSSIVVKFAGVSFFCSAVKSPLSDYKDWLVKVISHVLWVVRSYKFYLKDSSLPSTNTTRISGLILVIVNVAQGIFAFALMIYPVADWKDYLFVVIGYVVFCFWLRRFFPKELLPPSTNVKGITGMILSLKSIVTYSIVVLVGFEPRVHYRPWLVLVIGYVLWCIRLCTSFPKDLLLFLTVEFKVLQWWTIIALTDMISEVISCIKPSRTTQRQQQG